MEKFNAMRTRLLQHLQKKAIRSRSIMTLVCLLLASASAFAQTKTVTGTVTDAANEPLIGASVLVQGTSTGTPTAIPKVLTATNAKNAEPHFLLRILSTRKVLSAAANR